MPELPEVQTVINYLKTKILNNEITKILVKKEKFLKNSSVNDFKKLLEGKKIIDIKRIGKYIIFYLSNNLFLVVHLRMEGKFFIDTNLFDRKHDYIFFYLSNNKILIYNDTRQFGNFFITNNLNELKELTKIASDVLDPNFDKKLFVNKIKKSKKSIKNLLMDQTIISGIGNIYASEILFDSQILPFKKGFELSEEQIYKIIESSKKILKNSIKHHGTTIHSFSFGNNQTGQYNKYLSVVFRNKQKCLNCNNQIMKVKQNNRSTYYCNFCQK